ncbi:MAG: trigger factor [Candidatus Baltobacteraceae bacterium]
MTTSTLTRLDATSVEIVIPVLPDALERAREVAFRRLSKNARIPGFRKGHIPRRVFEQTYGTAGIESEAMEELVPELYGSALREHALAPVARPKLEMLPGLENEPMRVKARVEVRPTLELGTYAGLSVSVPQRTVSDEEVARTLEGLARDRGTLVPVDRPAALGDIVTIDFIGRIDGTPFEGGSAEGQVAELLEDRFIPGFATGIAGMKAGERREIETQFPEAYHASELAGKSAVFEVVLHDVKQLEMPTLDDAFAAEVSDFATIDELRAEVRKRLEGIAAARERREIGNALMEQLVNAHDIPVPPSLLLAEREQLLEEARRMAQEQGVEYPEYLASIGKTEEELRDELTGDAERRVKGTLLIEAIADAEGIEASPAEIQGELALLARRYGQPIDRVRAALAENMQSVYDGIIRNKTLEFLIDKAQRVAAP